MSKTIEDKLKEGRQYRNMQSFSAEEDMIARGYASTFEQPYLLFEYDDWDGYRVKFWEQVDRDAFNEADMSDTIMQYNHEGRVFARVKNHTLRIHTDDHGLAVEADLSGTELGRQLYEEIRGGYTDKMSFGFTVAKDTMTQERDDENKEIKVLRTITGIGRLYDVSAVSIPANDGTEISARSWCDGVIAELTEEFRKEAEKEKQKQRIRILTLTEV